MNHPHSEQLRRVELLKIAHALSALRDSLQLLSLALTDLATEVPSAEREAVMAAVKRYLSRIA
jgi:hypothetical protein